MGKRVRIVVLIAVLSLSFSGIAAASDHEGTGTEPAAPEELTEEGATALWFWYNAVLMQLVYALPDAEGETAARAADINERVSGWAYRIPKYKFDTMNKRMDDLLQEAEAQE